MAANGRRVREPRRAAGMDDSGGIHANILQGDGSVKATSSQRGSCERQRADPPFRARGDATSLARHSRLGCLSPDIRRTRLADRFCRLRHPAAPCVQDMGGDRNLRAAETPPSQSWEPKPYRSGMMPGAACAAKRARQSSGPNGKTVQAARHEPGRDDEGGRAVTKGRPASRHPSYRQTETEISFPILSPYR